MHTSNSKMRNRVDIGTIRRDLMQVLLPILLLSIAAGLFVSIYLHVTYQPRYTTRATLYISSSGKDNNVYSNLVTSSQTSATLTELLSSNILQKMVAEKSNLPSFQGKTLATNIPDTNLVELSVTSDSPRVSFLEIEAIMENYDTISEYLLQGVVLLTLQPPEISLTPDNPLELVRPVTTAVLLVFVVLMFVSALFSYLRDTVRTAEDVEKKLDASLLSSVPHEEKYHTLRDKLKQEKRGVLITDPSVSFRYVETMTALARKTMLRMDEQGRKVLLVSSIMENEGKSTITVNLATAMAMTGKRVLLIDGDMRKPAVYKRLNMQDAQFLSLGEVLKEKTDMRDLIQRMDDTDLHCILNKTVLSNSTEIIAEGVLGQIIEIMKAHFDYIVLDSSPLAMTADAEELLQYVDACVLVIRQHFVEAKIINDAIDVINGKEKKLLGCVLNDVRGKSLGITGYGSYNYSYGGKYGGYYGKH